MTKTPAPRYWTTEQTDALFRGENPGEPAGPLVCQVCKGTGRCESCASTGVAHGMKI